MATSESDIWLTAARETASSYRRMIDAVVIQLSEEELFTRPAPDINSVAILLRHLGGNLNSRWTDFFDTDGEKPTRNRDTEFLDWEGDRSSLMDHFDQGWSALSNALESIAHANVDQVVQIRGEDHSVPQAIFRSLTHVSYHVGQIAMVARTVHQGQWNWLTIAPNASAAHNKKSWGTASSRSVFADQEESDPQNVDERNSD